MEIELDTTQAKTENPIEQELPEVRFFLKDINLKWNIGARLERCRARHRQLKTHKNHEACFFEEYVLEKYEVDEKSVRNINIRNNLRSIQ